MTTIRYAKYGIAVAMLTSLLSVVPQQAFSQGGLTVMIEKDTYTTGELVKVTGKVSSVSESVPATIKVENPRGTLYTLGQSTPDAEGNFTFEFKVGGPLGIDGVYTVIATYSGQQQTATFTFAGGEVMPPTGGTIRVTVGDNVFDIAATLTNGKIMGIEADPDFGSVTIEVSMDDDGELTITLPRALIDARLGDDGRSGDDDTYSVTLDTGDDADFEETDTTATARTLVIQVPVDAAEVDIMGTWVVPEFGVLAALALAAALGAFIAISRKNQLMKLLPRY